MRVMISVLLLLTLAFAGCASKGGGDGDASPTSTATASGSASKSASATKSTTATGTSSTTTTNASAANRVPTAQISGSVASGSLRVNFTVDGADPDGDALAWNLTFGDGSGASGATVPANATHTYAAAGTFTATVRISDGRLNATASVNVTVAAGAPASQSFEGEWAIGSVDIPFAVTEADGGCDAIEGLDGVFLALFDVDQATIGKPYTATITATSTSDSIVAWEVKFLDAGCAILEGPYLDGSGPITGTVPAGAIHAWMSSDGGAAVTGTYKAG